MRVSRLNVRRRPLASWAFEFLLFMALGYVSFQLLFAVIVFPWDQRFISSPVPVSCISDKDGVSANQPIPICSHTNSSSSRSRSSSTIVAAQRDELWPPVDYTVAFIRQEDAKVPPISQAKRPSSSLHYHGSRIQAQDESRSRVALIAPYRKRPLQLQNFSISIQDFLRHQNIDAHIFVVEQLGKSRFNRGSLLNIGFIEATSQPWRNIKEEQDYDCVVTHDIDLIPVSDSRNSYDCLANASVRAIQLSTAIDWYGWKLANEWSDGGVCMFRTQTFEHINGFSNRFFGWGGEDNDLRNRLESRNITFHRRPKSVGRYVALKTGHYRDIEDWTGMAAKRLHLLRHSKRFSGEGLSTIRYRVVGRSTHPLYTMISVILHPQEDTVILKRLGDYRDDRSTVKSTTRH
eukprot:scpid50787/ scgid25552/ Beta-1,4-N-acetylgalactosaminyltransferase bre-4; Bacillus thuringiensis toxin-resistant protein 4; Beta-4-GalNAcT